MLIGAGFNNRTLEVFIYKTNDTELELETRFREKIANTRDVEKVFKYITELQGEVLKNIEILNDTVEYFKFTAGYMDWQVIKGKNFEMCREFQVRLFEARYETNKNLDRLRKEFE